MGSMRYYAQENPCKSPVIIGLPGFIHESEKSRIDCALELALPHGIYGIRVNFSGIEKNERGVSCTFNLNNYIEDVKEAFDQARKITMDEKPIGVITSSMSSGVFLHFLSKNEYAIPLIRAHVAVSPLDGWESFKGQEVCKALVASNRDIPLLEDHEGKCKRVITKESFSQFEYSGGGMKSLKEKLYHCLPIPALTLIGKEDKIVHLDSMRKYHSVFASNKSLKIEFDDQGHAINRELYESDMINFLRKCLLN